MSKDLFKLRFIVLSEYPDSRYKVGDIIELHSYIIDSVDHVVSASGHDQTYFEKYPQIFRKLEWWEERSVEDLPRYLKCIDGKVVRSLFKYKEDTLIVLQSNMKGYYAIVNSVTMKYRQPATEEEYINFKKESNVRDIKN